MKNEKIKIVLFNGPPRSGKDTAGALLKEYLHPDPGVKVFKMAQPLKCAVHEIFGLHGFAHDALEEVKDEACGELFGMSPRQAYIWLSEEVMKPKFGQDFFAKVAVTAIKQMGEDIIVFTDCGFQQEVDVLVEAFGAAAVLVVQMVRPDTSFANDSRHYVSHKHLVYISNNGDKLHLRNAVYELACYITGQEYQLDKPFTLGVPDATE